MLKVIAAALLSVAIAVPAIADEVYKGTLACAKCTLKKADAHECQDVLLIEGKGETTEYYIVKNEVAEAAGETCTVKVPATVTGTVAKDKNGRLWLTASKIEKQPVGGGGR